MSEQQKPEDRWQVVLDFETCSAKDLRKVGADVYTKHSSTEIRLMSWSIYTNFAALRDFPDEPHDRGVWRPDHGAMRELLQDAIKYGVVHAFNAPFEQAVFANVLSRATYRSAYKSAPTPRQWRCVAALCRSRGLPGGLKEAAKAMHLPVQKEDPAIMRLMADAGYTPNDRDWIALMEYCEADRDATAHLIARLPPLTDDEQFSYEVCEKINQRGVRVDTKFAARAADVIEIEKNIAAKRLSDLTNGEVTKPTQVKRMMGWLQRQSVYLPKLDKQHVAEAIKNRTLSIRVREVLGIRLEASASAGSKYLTMLNQTDGWNGRLRGMFVFAGAGRTGRYSSKGVQVHNLRRDVPKNIAFITGAMHHSSLPESASRMNALYGRGTLAVLAASVRAALVPAEDSVFYVGDYKSVEARGLPWLAEEENEVNAYRNGVDRYIEDAAKVFGCLPEDVTDEQRQIGKVLRLACGFSGKGGALMAMAEGYGLALEEDEAKRLAYAWHNANPWAEQFAMRLFAEAITALRRQTGDWHEVPRARGIAYRYNGELDALECRLPSGRVLYYRRPRITEDDNLEVDNPRGYRERIWHGTLSENVTQAMCNDLLRHGLAMLGAEGYRVVLHVHDEAVAEVVKYDRAVKTLEKFKRALADRPPWAADFPLEVDAKVMERYGK